MFFLTYFSCQFTVCHHIFKAVPGVVAALSLLEPTESARQPLEMQQLKCQHQHRLISLGCISCLMLFKALFRKTMDNGHACEGRLFKNTPTFFHLAAYPALPPRESSCIALQQGTRCLSPQGNANSVLIGLG